MVPPGFARVAVARGLVTLHRSWCHCTVLVALHGATGLCTGPGAIAQLLPPSSRSFVLRDLAAGREYDLCVSALYAEGAAALPTARALGCVRFATPGGAPGCAALPRPHFLGGTVIIVIGAAIAASVLVFILILTARYKAAAARRPPAAVASVCSQTNGTHRPPEPEPPPPPPPPPPLLGCSWVPEHGSLGC
uniref:Uncharacterized protein n=1 Tax=Otus sunia TaxID=257818 RepID=A0A8C8AHH0_9STRI